MQLDALPLFPLEIVLYPDEVLPLHIFEGKYIDLISDCLKHKAPFGIVLTTDGKLKEIGCTASISKVTESFEDGRKNVIVTGLERFRITHVYHNRTYLTADFETVIDQKGQSEKELIERLIAQHIKLLELAGRTPSPSLYEDRNRLAYFIAHNAGLTLEQKQNVLENNAESSRIKFLIDHLERFIPAVEEAESMRKQVRTNGHFQDFPPDS